MSEADIVEAEADVVDTVSWVKDAKRSANSTYSLSTRTIYDDDSQIRRSVYGELV